MTAMDADPREPRKAVERALAKAARQINASLDYYDELGFARDVLDTLDANPEAKAALAAWTATPAETGLRHTEVGSCWCGHPTGDDVRAFYATITESPREER